MLLAVVLPLLAAEVAKADDYFETFVGPHYQHQHSWTVPAGVIAATVNIQGAGGGGFIGGRGGSVRATLNGLTPGASLTICLGGKGSQATALHGGGGVMGGGNAPLGAYGGGGSTDIRLAAFCTVGADTRLMVAAGGGGAGGASSDSRMGGSPGSVGNSAGAGAFYADEFSTHVTGGGGGGAGSSSAAGTGGPGAVAGNTNATSDVNVGAAGGSGLADVGGSGGQPASGLPDEGWGESGFFSAGGGGGGGAGYFAGGGGGGGGFYRGGGILNLVPPGATGGGGGGAGSNCSGRNADGPPVRERPYMTCAGFSATSIYPSRRVDGTALSHNQDGAVAIWYPNVSIDSPAAGASFQEDAAASASFTCAVDVGPPLRETDPCVGVVTKPDGSTANVSSGDALPTDTGGTHTLSVTAVDAWDGTRRLTRSYTVVASAPPANVDLPTITGTPVVGQTLEATPGSWTGTAPILYSYRWQTCRLALQCVDIEGEAGSGATHTLTAADRGLNETGPALRVIVTATNAFGSVSASSEETAPLKPTPVLPSGVSIAIGGVPEAGQTLTLELAPSWVILFPDYEWVVRWERCSTLICVDNWQAIPGATGPSYVLTGDDVGARIAVVVQLKSYSILGQAYAAVAGPIAPRDEQPPELNLTPAASDAEASTGWYNRATSGSDGVAVDVAAADPSGIANLVCHDGDDVVLTIDDTDRSIVLGEGRHAIECVATDNRSNTTTASAQFDVDQTKPSVTLPPITVSATGPDGAAVNYLAVAADNLDPFPAVVCNPGSGIFPIGTTAVICQATDDAGNSETTQFVVTVLGASEQLELLQAAATGIGTGTSLADKVKKIQKAVDAGRTRNACTGLTEFLNLVSNQAAKGRLTSTQAASLTTQATRIQATLSC